MVAFVECCQQVEGGDPSPLLSISEAIPDVLCLVLCFPVQEIHAAKGHQDDQGTLAYLLGGDIDKVRTVQPREEKAWGHLTNGY